MRIAVENKNNPHVEGEKINEAIVNQTLKDEKTLGLGESEKRILVPLLKHYLLLHDLHRATTPHGARQIFYDRDEYRRAFLNHVSRIVLAHENLLESEKPICDDIRRNLGMNNNGEIQDKVALARVNASIRNLKENTQVMAQKILGKEVNGLFGALDRNRRAAHHAYGEIKGLSLELFKAMAQI